MKHKMKSNQTKSNLISSITRVPEANGKRASDWSRYKRHLTFRFSVKIKEEAKQLQLQLNGLG